MSGAELEAWRKALGWSRAEAGQVLACSANSVYSMERRDRPISALREGLCWLMTFPKVREGYLQRIGFVASEPAGFPRRRRGSASAGATEDYKGAQDAARDVSGV